MAQVPDTAVRGSPFSPLVSVIIPARDEEQCIGTCTESLVTQAAESQSRADATERATLVTPDGLPYEIIVVDDGSTDQTATIAGSFSGVRVISADPLRHGWTGKCNACATGARHARGSWLLFTDADTMHAPNSLARSLEEIKSCGADLLSFSPRQQVSGFAQRTLMPLVFAELARTYRPRDVCDPASPIAAANGQFLLIRRDAYRAIGGHAAVGGDLLEDVALARLIKQSGGRIRFRYGGELVRTRMYRSFRQMREGWTKNLVLLFPSAGKLTFFLALEFTAGVGGAVAAALALASGARVATIISAAVSGLTLARLYRRVHKAHFGTFSTIISPLGLPLFSYLLLRSRIFHKKGAVAWRGRQYSGSAAQAGSQLPASANSSEAVRG